MSLEKFSWGIAVGVILCLIGTTMVGYNLSLCTLFQHAIIAMISVYGAAGGIS